VATEGHPLVYFNNSCLPLMLVLGARKDSTVIMTHRNPDVSTGGAEISLNTSLDGSRWWHCC